jgi:hypothetical protein
VLQGILPPQLPRLSTPQLYLRPKLFLRAVTPFPTQYSSTPQLFPGYNSTTGRKSCLRRTLFPHAGNYLSQLISVPQLCSKLRLGPTVQWIYRVFSIGCRSTFWMLSIGRGLGGTAPRKVSSRHRFHGDREVLKVAPAHTNVSRVTRRGLLELQAKVKWSCLVEKTKVGLRS